MRYDDLRLDELLCLQLRYDTVDKARLGRRGAHCLTAFNDYGRHTVASVY